MRVQLIVKCVFDSRRRGEKVVTERESCHREREKVHDGSVAEERRDGASGGAEVSVTVSDDFVLPLLSSLL